MSGGLWPTPPDLFGPNYALVSDFLDKLKGLSAQSASAIAARVRGSGGWCEQSLAPPLMLDAPVDVSPLRDACAREGGDH